MSVENLKLQEVVSVFIRSNNGSYLLQLRDKKPSIAFPGHWGLFGGAIENGESVCEAASRELEEEIGYRANSMKEITEIHPCIGYSDERMWIYLAEELTYTKTNQDLDEFLELMPTELSDSVGMVWSGKITDVKSIIGILWANRLLN